MQRLCAQRQDACVMAVDQREKKWLWRDKLGTLAPRASCRLQIELLNAVRCSLFAVFAV